MTSTAERHNLDLTQPLASRWLTARELWGAVAMVTMWIAVLFTAIYGGDAIFTSTDGSSSRLPSAVFVALFAFLASASVAKRAFGPAAGRPRGSASTAEHTQLDG